MCFRLKVKLESTKPRCKFDNPYCDYCFKLSCRKCWVAKAMKNGDLELQK